MSIDDTEPSNEYLARMVKEAEERGYQRGVEKGAEISRYHRDKNGARALPAWVAACNDIKTSCLATAGRIRRGEYENPIAVCMSAPKKEGGG